MKTAVLQKITILALAAAILTFRAAAPPALQAEEVVVNAVGDIMLAGRWAGQIREKGYDYPFAATRSELLKGDISLANLEAPLARRGREFTDKKFRFLGDPQLAPALKRAGIHVVTLANNHSMDFGAAALSETMLNLEKAGILWVGAGSDLRAARQAAIVEVKGKRVAFLGYSLTLPEEFYATDSRAGTAPGHADLFVEDIAAARKMADYVIVSFHWGTEGSSSAKPYQQAAARRAIRAGADAVIGHHPHVLQGVERYKGGIIFYSLGNFAFASKGRTAVHGAMVRLRLNGASREAELLPLDVYNRRVQFQPRLLAKESAAEVIVELNRLSRPLGTVIESREGRHFVRF